MFVGGVGTVAAICVVALEPTPKHIMGGVQGVAYGMQDLTVKVLSKFCTSLCLFLCAAAAACSKLPGPRHLQC